MTNEELKKAIQMVNDGGSAQVFAEKVIAAKDPELKELFLGKVIEKASEGHHQTKEFALAGLKVLRG